MNLNLSLWRTPMPFLPQRGDLSFAFLWIALYLSLWLSFAKGNPKESQAKITPMITGYSQAIT